MRTGWLLWQQSLREFIYFEKEMLQPNLDDYYAEWRERKGGGTRKASRNLWVYEHETGIKRYSITTSAGPKIQLYFDIPSPRDPDLHYFCVQGEEFENGLVRVWLNRTTALLLKSEFGSLEGKTISNAIVKAAKTIREQAVKKENGSKCVDNELAQPIFITIDAYEALRSTFEGVSDEHLFQLFARDILSET